MRDELALDGADVEPGEIGQEARNHFQKAQDAPKPLTSVRMRVCSRPNQCGVTGGIRLGLVLALILCAACEPRKPPPMVSHGTFIDAEAPSPKLMTAHIL